MLLINNITSQALQTQNLVLPDGTIVSMTIAFKPRQLGWFIQSMTYGDFVLEGKRISVSPNILFQFMNKIPFGLACFAKDSREPTLQEDFASGNAKLYFLTTAEKEEYADLLRG